MGVGWKGEQVWNNQVVRMIYLLKVSYFIFCIMGFGNYDERDGDYK